MSLAEDIEAMVVNAPGLTESEIAMRLYGPDAYQQLVNSTCRRLVARGRIRREGAGNRDPFRYHIVR